MTTVAHQAVQLRDRIRALIAAVEDARRVANLEELADDVRAKAAAVRYWWQVARVLSPNGPLPQIELPDASVVAQLRQQSSREGILTPTAITEQMRQLREFHNRLGMAEFELRRHCQNRGLCLAAAIAQEAKVAQTALRLDLATRLSSIAAEITQIMREERPPLLRLRDALADYARCQDEIGQTVEAGSEALKAFLREVATPDGAALSKLDSPVLDELKRNGLAASLAVRMK